MGDFFFTPWLLRSTLLDAILVIQMNQAEWNCWGNCFCKQRSLLYSLVPPKFRGNLIRTKLILTLFHRCSFFQLRNVENEPVSLLVAHPAGQWLQLLQSPEEDEQKNVDIIYLPHGNLKHFHTHQHQNTVFSLVNTLPLIIAVEQAFWLKIFTYFGKN